jgi:hypothetical protein
MKLFALLSFVALLVPGFVRAQDACYADYKASREKPLELQYGVAEVRGECTVPAAEAEIAPRIAVDGWQLLEVMDTFGAGGLEQRRESAGDYFLRY